MMTDHKPQAKPVSKVFKRLGIMQSPVMLAPLAGVSDFPFRQVCREQGAHLVYVEMLSAIALSYYSKNTMAMIHRHYKEDVLGAQITASDADQMAKGVSILDHYPIDTIDINMGCPVKKVVKTGCGSALLKDPEKVFKVVKAACDHTGKIVSAKIRLGWSPEQAYPLEVADACQQAGVAWLTVHGRLRCDRYSVPVDLEGLRRIKQHITIPLIGNGNLFHRADIDHMLAVTGADGVMISRGALGNPWIFQSRPSITTVSQWHATVSRHIRLSLALYGDHKTPAIRFRKHLLWYLKGWSVPQDIRIKAQNITSLHHALYLARDLADHLRSSGVYGRKSACGGENKWQEGSGGDKMWDPKFEMSRTLDRGVGDDGM